jgi:hypothetical protein
MTAGDFMDVLRARSRSALSGDRVVTADETGDWPVGTLDNLLEARAIVPIEPATSAACTECDDDHTEIVQVVEEPPGSETRFYISCPNIGRVRIEAANLRRWRLVGPDYETKLSRGLEVCACGLEHSDDFRWVKSGSETFSLTSPQAGVIGLLHQAFLDGQPEMTWPQISAKLGLSSVNMSQVFKGERRWRTLIAKSRRSLYRLLVF